jgi:hypothetical protein
MGLRDSAAERYRKWEADQDAANAAQIARAATPASGERAPQERSVVDTRQPPRHRPFRSTSDPVYASSVAATCPLPLAKDPRGKFLSGAKLQPDEFLVVIGKDWHWSSQRLILTTRRVISTQGSRASRPGRCTSTDMRDVRYAKPMIGAASITLEPRGVSGGSRGSRRRRMARRYATSSRLSCTGREHARRPRGSLPLLRAPPSEDVLAGSERRMDCAGARPAWCEGVIQRVERDRPRSHRSSTGWRTVDQYASLLAEVAEVPRSRAELFGRSRGLRVRPVLTPPARKR